MINTDDIKAQHNIVDYIDRYVPLKKNGKDHFGCCPFHNEKTPSFSVNEQKQFYHCFGCGAQGSVIDFVMEYQGVEFLQACEILGHKAALKPSESLKNKRENEHRKITLPLHYQEPLKKEVIADFFAKCELFKNPTSEEAIYYYQGHQAVMLTDTRRNPVGGVLVKSGFKPKYLGKEFLYGSCVVFGEIKEEVYLCEKYHDAKSLNAIEGKNAICFFEPNNIYFIYQMIDKSKVKVFAKCESEEAKFQASKLIIGDYENV
jgi:hypothetical protein